jgi:hypothetical protein
MRYLPTPHEMHAHRIYIDHVPPNAKPDYLASILDEVVGIVRDLVNALQLTNLGACSCSGRDILVLIATLIKVLVILLSGSFLLCSYFPTAGHH